MATLEQPPRYNDSYQEFEVPSYNSSLQQLQNLPPPLNDEPSILDRPVQPVNHYEVQQSGSMILMENTELITPPPYEQTNERLDRSQVPVNNDGSLDQFNGYPTGEVEDKIKDILSRYNPHAPKENQQQIFDAPSPPQTQPTARQQQVTRPIQSAPQAPQVPQVQQMQKPNQFQGPPQQQTLYPSGAYSQEVHVNTVPQQNQLRARVVQNVPAQSIVQSPPPQRYQQQPQPQVIQQTTSQVHSAPPSPQLHQQQQQQQVHQQPIHQQPVQAPHVYQQQPVHQQPQYQQQSAVQPAVQPIPQSAQADHGTYLQLVQQQAIQFQLQNQQIQQLQQQSNQQSKEVLNQMQAYFERINSFMERADKRLNNLENTAQAILKSQRNNNNDDLTSFVSKNEINVLKQMQEQMESDFDVAKRLQAELDNKYLKEKNKEEKKKEKKSKSSSSPSSSRSTSSSTSPSSLQECPICTLKVPFAELEFHVNQCLESIEKTSGDTKTDTTNQEKASFWRRVFGPGPKKDDSNQSSTSKSLPPPSRPALPAPVSSSSSIGQAPMYPSGQDFYQMPQMPFVYRGGYPQPQMVPQQIYPYPQQQIYYYPPGMAQPQQGAKK